MVYLGSSIDLGKVDSRANAPCERPPDEHPRHPPELTRLAVVARKLFAYLHIHPRSSILEENSKLVR